MTEAIIEPDLPIIDPHHHLWDLRPMVPMFPVPHHPFIAALADNAVPMGLRVWCNAGDFLPLTWTLNEAVKLRFDALGMTIPTGVASAATAPMPAAR